MSSSRRVNLRKSKNTSKDANQSISNFVQRRSTKDECVEIIEEDDVQDLSDQFAFTDETVSRPLRRRKRHIIVDEESDTEDNTNGPELEGMEDLDEDERQQMKEALRQSRLELEKDSKRRAYDIFESADFKKEERPTELPTTFEADLPSSPISSGFEEQYQERAESPDLFATPQSINEKEQDGGIPENPASPKNVSRTSTKTTFDKEINIQLSPIERPLPKRSLSLKKGKEPSTDKEESSRDNEPSHSTSNSKDEEKITNKTFDSKKRKHTIEDDSDDDDDFDAEEKHTTTESIPVVSRKKQKTIEDTFSVLSSKHNPKQKVKTEPEHFIINDDDGDLLDENEVGKRTDSTRKLKKSFRVSLQRTYKNPKLPIRTIKDAMKARLFFAPPGIDHKLYTYAIMRMFDHTKECIRKAQQKRLQFVKWGLPIVVGPREGNTLDAKKDKRKSHHLAVAANDPSELKRRSLRSAQSNPTVSKIKKDPDPADAQLKSQNIGYIDSDDSDEELTKSVFGDKENKPKNWKEYISKTEYNKFGENIITSAGLNEKDGKKAVDSVEKKFSKQEETSETKTKDDLGTKCTNVVSNSVAKKKQTPELDEKRDSTPDEGDKEDSDIYGPTMMYFTETATPKESQMKESTDESATKPKDNQGHTERPMEFRSKRKSSRPTKYTQKQYGSDMNGSDDDVDSSVEIGRNKSKRLASKAPVIKDCEDEKNDKTCEVDVDLVDIDEDSFTGSNKVSKPGESLTDVAVKSGYLKVDRHSNKPPVVQRKVSTPARKALEAVERRLRGASTATDASSPEITSSIEPSQEGLPTEEDLVQCPMCYAHFSLGDIEAHAATCNGTPPEANQEVTSSRRGLSDGHSQASTSADPTVQQTQHYGLKNLRVVVAKSPEAQRRLVEQRNVSFTAKRYLSLRKRDKPGRNITEERVAEYVDMTSDQEDTPKEDEADGLQNQDDSQGNSQKSSWLTSSSQERRKKERFKVTYGGKKKTATCTKNPFSTLDFIPLQEQPSSSDSEGEHTMRIPSAKITAADGVRPTPKPQGDAYVNIDSGSNSDSEMFAVHGLTEPKKKKTAVTRNINDVLRPRMQDITSTIKKQQPGDDFDEDDYANEMALMELAGMPGKRPRADNQSKTSKRRRKRATISSDDSEENDDYEKCYICDQRVLKDVYNEHTESCMTKKRVPPITPGKSYGHTTDTGNRKSSKQPSQLPSTSSNTIEMDSDEIGDSPIKTFKLIGEEGKSAVDYENQFAFFGSKNTRSSSKRGSKGGRGRGKGRFKKKHWYKKSS